jgi:hypothetical protein
VWWNILVIPEAQEAEAGFKVRPRGKLARPISTNKQSVVYISIIPATWEAKVGGLKPKADLNRKHETLSEK